MGLGDLAGVMNLGEGLDGWLTENQGGSGVQTKGSGGRDQEPGPI